MYSEIMKEFGAYTATIQDGSLALEDEAGANVGTADSADCATGDADGIRDESTGGDASATPTAAVVPTDGNRTPVADFAEAAERAAVIGAVPPSEVEAVREHVADAPANNGAVKPAAPEVQTDAADREVAKEQDVNAKLEASAPDAEASGGVETAAAGNGSDDAKANPTDEAVWAVARAEDVNGGDKESAPVAEANGGGGEAKDTDVKAPEADVEESTAGNAGGEAKDTDVEAPDVLVFCFCFISISL